MPLPSNKMLITQNPIQPKAQSKKFISELTPNGPSEIPKLTPHPDPKELGLRFYRLGAEAKHHNEMIDLLSFYLMNNEIFIDDENPATTKG